MFLKDLKDLIKRSCFLKNQKKIKDQMKLVFPFIIFYSESLTSVKIPNTQMGA